MARVKGGFTTRRRRKKVLKLAKGYFGAKHRLYKTAHEQSSILLTILKTSSTLLLKSIFISTLFLFIPPKQYNINLL